MARNGGAPAGPSAGPAFGHLLALHLVQAAPDAMGLMDTDGGVEALVTHGAGSTDRLGPFFALDLLVLALGVRRGEEHFGMRPAARGPELPRICRLRHEPLP